jgi:hypothetical protein
MSILFELQQSRKGPNTIRRKKLKYILSGKRFGDIDVLYRTDYENKKIMWLCVCDCGSITKVASNDLISGHTKSCGCGKIKSLIKRATTHGHSSNGTITKSYRRWLKIKNRCHNENDKDYKYYGGRGIKVCERWAKFENFYSDMGDVPDGMTIEREDNDKGYSPDNCKWATPMEQANNRRSNTFYTYENQTLTFAQWCRRNGIKPETVDSRMRKGMSFEDAITKQIKKPALHTYNGITATAMEWSNKTGIPKKVISNRIGRGWSTEDALTKPLRAINAN